MIAIVYPQFYGVGGIARYLDSFLANLPDEHPTIYLITGDEHRMERHYPGVVVMHIPFSSNRLNLFKWGWQARNVLNRLYAEGKIQWVNLHFPPLIPGLMLPGKIPMVLTAHTTYLGMSGQFYEKRHFESQWHGISLTVKSWMEHQIFSRASKVITLTEQGRQEVLRYGFNKPIEVIPNGVDLQRFVPGTRVRKDIDVLFCGRIEMRKGSRAMAELCQQLVSKKPDIKICIVGYGEDEDWVRKAMAPIASNVRLTGKVSFADTISYYKRSRVYVSTSYYEGLPGTCLEAMAMRLPAVVWDFLFYRSLVVDGVTGYLVPPNDFALMTTLTLKLLGNSRLVSRMGREGRALLENDYGWNKLAVNILGVFGDDTVQK